MVGPISQGFASVLALLLLLLTGPAGPSPAQAQDIQIAQNRSDEVEGRKNLQRQLQALGLYHGSIDGIYGPGTRRGWEEFARAANVGLEITQESWQLLLDSAEVRRARGVGLREAIRSARTLPEGRALLGRANRLHKDGRYAEAIPLYDRALAFFENALGREHRYLLGFVHNRGLAYTAKGEHDRALADYHRALRLDPNYAQAYNDRGNAYVNKGEYDRAIADYDNAIRLDPKYALAYNNRGLAYYHKRNYDRAIAGYDNAIRLDPKYALAYNNRGLAYYHKRNYDRAIADYNHAIRLDPKQQLYAYNHRGLAYAAKGEHDRALADYDQAIRLDAKYALAYNNRGNAYLANGDLYRALADHTRANRLDTKYHTYYDYGKLFAKSGDRSCTRSKKRESVGALGRYEFLNLFGDAFEVINSSYAEEPEAAHLMEAAIDGMLSALDPYSKFINARDFRDMQLQSQTGFGGFGIEMAIENNVVKVVAAIENTPAARAGLEPADLITHINAVPLRGTTLREVVDQLRGPVGSTGVLTVIRDGVSKPFDLEMAREVIRLIPISWRAENDIGYIKITTFNEQTYKSFQDAVADLRWEIGDDKLKGYVIDLRNNEGGLLDEVIAASGALIDKGVIAVSFGCFMDLDQSASNADDTAFRGKRSHRSVERFTARAGDLTGGNRLVVLVNGGTASGAEIMAAALQDRRRATLVGTRSFGTGTVQTIIPLGRNGALRLTTSRWYRPAGQSIQAKGVEPDVVVEQPVPNDVTAEIKAEANLRGHLPSEDGQQYHGSSTYVPTDSALDTQLQYALALIRKQAQESQLIDTSPR